MPNPHFDITITQPSAAKASRPCVPGARLFQAGPLCVPGSWLPVQDSAGRIRGGKISSRIFFSPSST